MEERHYVIRVSALLDRSTSQAAGDLLHTYDRAAKGAGRRMTEEQRQAKRAADERVKAEKHVADVKERYFREEQRRGETREREEKRAIDRTAREHERAEQHVAQIKERHFRDEQRRSERAERSANNERRQRMKQIASDAVENAAAIASKAASVGKEIAGGLGLDFSLQSGVSKAVNLEKMAVAIVNAGNRGTGTAAERDADVVGLQKTARDIGNKYAIDPTQVLSGLSQYQALTGDLDTAKAGLDDLARLAKAFNTDLNTMVAAAGQVGSAIGEIGEGKEFANAEEKAKAVLEVLKGLTAQGQEGAIEISDLARQMAGLKAAAVKFGGGTSDNMLKMGALAQLAYQTGGARSAAQATTAVMGFANTLATPARRREFAAAGVEIEDKKTGKFLDPFEIIRKSLIATKGDTESMKKLFANVVGERAVASLTSAYKGAGGGQKGIDAVNAQLDRFSKKATDEVITENLNRNMGTKASKAQIQQNAMDERWAALTEKIMPSLEKLAPAVDKSVDAFASLVEFVANHLGLSIGIAIAGSIAKAAIGPMIGKVIAEQVAANGLGGALGKAAGGIPGGGAALAGVTILATAAYLSVKEFNQNKEGAAKSEQERMARAQELLGEADKGKLSKDKREELMRLRAEMEGSVGLAKKYNAGEDLNWFEKFGSGLVDFFGDEEMGKKKAEIEGRGKEAAGSLEKMEALNAKMDALLAATKDNKQKGPVDVNIVGGAVVAGAGSTGQVGVPDQGG